MARQSAERPWKDLTGQTIDRLFSDAPGFEFLILKGHLLVEDALNRLIDASLQKPEQFPDRSRLRFPDKIGLACALGVLPEDYVGPTEALNRMRNKIAHPNGFNLKLGDLLELRLNWKDAEEREVRSDFKADPNEATRTAVILLVMQFAELFLNRRRSRRRVAKP